MAVGYRSTLATWVGGAGVPSGAAAPTVGFRSGLGFWVGGVGVSTGPAPATVGFNSSLAFWTGGAGTGAGVIPPTPPDEVIKTGTGGIDPGDGLRRRRIVKPTGLVERRRERDPGVQRRLDESREIQAEVAGELARELRGEVEEIELAQFKAIEKMTAAEIDAEIGLLLRKQLRTEEEEILLMFMVMMLAIA